MYNASITTRIVLTYRLRGVRLEMLKIQFGVLQSVYGPDHQLNDIIGNYYITR